MPHRELPWTVALVSDQTRPGPAPARRRERPDGLLAAKDGHRIHAREQAVACTAADGRHLWTCPLEGLRCTGAYLSGGRVLVTTDTLAYTPWGFTGPALLLDLADGAPLAEQRAGSAAALSGGRFLVGLRGYDVFDTWQYAPDGTVADSWRSCGHLVVGSGVRVVETRGSTAEPSRVVRLHPGGVVEPGPELTESQVGRPVVLEDGTVLVLDAGVLRAVDRALAGTVLAELLPVPAGEHHRFLGSLRREGEHLVARIEARDPEDPRSCTTRTWTFALRRRPGS
ncbi:hypothetical protein [Kitasatospora sp. NPDC051705]|uniref:hypothetical protein n=1 Tax=Kitasatospora sp. NPDC051705 TaxID=3364057 RepID=UPI0037B8EE06